MTERPFIAFRIILLLAVSLATAVHPVQLNAVPLVVAVERRLCVLFLPLAAEGSCYIPTCSLLTEEHLVQRATLVVLGAVPSVLGELLKPWAGCRGDLLAVLPGHVGPILSDADVEVVTAAAALREAPLRAACAPENKK